MLDIVVNDEAAALVFPEVVPALVDVLTPRAVEVAEEPELPVVVLTNGEEELASCRGAYWDGTVTTILSKSIVVHIRINLVQE